jgi:adenosyl cobinamide kinase/adenosyl cobinamide phosphate guanylyltransferase
MVPASLLIAGTKSGNSAFADKLASPAGQKKLIFLFNIAKKI